MPKIATYADILADRELKKAQQPSNFSEGTELCVTCSQSFNGRTHSRSTMCKFDIEPTFNNHAGFPLEISIIVKRGSSISTAFSNYILDYKTDKIFWIPYDHISSDIDALDFISKRIFLMNVPFTLGHKLKWKSTSYRDVKTTCMLENEDMLISKIAKLAKNMKDCPTLPYNGEWSMSLVITKVIYLPHMEFMEMYNKLDLKRDYISETWQRSQGELDARIATLEALVKEVDIKNLRFEAAGTSEGSNLVDICSICREEFLEGSMISCISICSHVYHDTCLLEWLLRNRSCPYCRSELTKKI